MKLQVMIESIDSIRIFYFQRLLRSENQFKEFQCLKCFIAMGGGVRRGGSKESQNNQDAANDGNKADDCI